MAGPLPEKFITTISSTFGDAGRAWLAGLPELLAACCARWDLRLGQPYLLSFNYVAPAEDGQGRRLVLKAGVPNPEMDTEVAALRLCQGRGLVRLVDFAPELGALLLDRLEPGTMLADVHGTLADDEQATRIIARVMRDIWRPVPAGHPFHPLERWTRGIADARVQFGGGTGPIPRRTFEKAERLLAELLPTQGETVLLHGDLHHYNILRVGDGSWQAIDPKGLAGEREFEVGPLFYNPFDLEIWPDLAKVYTRRLDILVEELGFDRQRIARWALVEQVLSMCWSLSDEPGNWEPEQSLPLAAAMDPLVD